MANHERGRSPSAGQGSHLNTHRSTSASPHPALDSTSYHPSLPPYNNGVLGAQTSSIAFGDPSFTRPENYLLGQQQTLGGDQTFLSSQSFGAQSANTANSFGYLQSGAEQISPTTNTGSSAFPAFDFNSTTVDYSQDTSLDPSLLEHLDLQSQTNSGVPMAAPMQPPSPTPPHMLQPEMARRQSNSPSPSPNYQQQQGGFGRPRNTSESLEVPGAMYSQGQHQQAEWGNMGGYRGHYRTPSDQISDYSSQGHHSNQASPYMPTYDSFEGAHSSPLINAQQDPVINDGLGFQRFSLSDQSQPPPQQAYQHSPGHSPRISPQLLPQQQISQQQQALPLFTAQDGYGMNANNQFGAQPNQAGLEMFPPLSKPQSPSDFGAADQMSPPEISVEFAPPVAGSLGVNVPGVKIEEQEGLSPPARTQSRNRRRAVSESFAGSSRPTSPALGGGRGRSPSLQPYTADNFSHSSRSPSPARGRDKSGNRVRSTSHASDQRDYILNLAEPERTPSNGATGGRESNSGRVQKHPATFQCTLCPKRFTRAYNLRSHLRTHTDERPFVCTVCGKAFARQHDRKRHEGLHSGEKKFVCKGTLTSGLPWGCGRRFARADALGRHFRSEAGRVCIKPLLEEERVERERAWMEEQQAAQVAHGLVAPQPMMGQPQMGMDNNFLPAVLLQQYPALQNIDWSQIPPGAGQPGDDGEIGDYSDGGMGRSSFEHSSGGEYNDYDVSENEMEMGGMQQPYGGAVQGGMHPGMGMQTHAGAGQQGYYGGSGGYLEDFEGR